MRPEEVIEAAGHVQVDLSNPKSKNQKDFLLDIRKYSCYSGGFGSGKTTICCLKGLIISSLMPKNLGAVFRQTYPDLRESTREVFLSITPGDWIKYWREAENALTLKNGSVILFRHFENNKVKVGANLGWFFLDQAEEADKSIFLALQGRLRRQVPRQYGMMAMNPNGKDWQYKMFFDNPKPSYSGYQSSAYDNEHNLPPDYISDLEANYPDDWIDRFVKGSWTTMSGLIFHEFDQVRHMVDPFRIPPHWIKARGMDWGVDAPATAIHVTLEPPPHSRRFVFMEYGEREQTPDQHARTILRESRPFNPYKATILDSSAFNREGDLKSVADKFKQAGLMVWPGTRDIHARILHQKWLLKTNRLFFFKGKTRMTIEEMESWKWGARRSGKEIPARGNDHYLDGLGYILYWLDRKFFYRDGTSLQTDPGRRDSEAKLTVPQNTIDQADPVTGMPA